MKLKTLTIGIPAYNEEANIKNLLEILVSQNKDNFLLEKIMVVSDGSIDGTVKKVKEFKNGKIVLLENSKRLGVNKTQNKILEVSNSDILVIINADVLMLDVNFLNKLIEPFYRNQNLGIISTSMVPVKPRSFVSRVLSYAQILKETLYRKINNANNVYLCHGQLRAFAKPFYSKFRWPENYPEDSFSYFACLKAGFGFKYLSDLEVIYQTSNTVSDHVLQSNRFLFGIDKLKKIFGKKYVEQSYQIPYGLFAAMVMYFLLRNPILMVSYILLASYIRYFKKTPPIHHSKFEIATSSKIIFSFLFFGI